MIQLPPARIPRLPLSFVIASQLCGYLNHPLLKVRLQRSLKHAMTHHRLFGTHASEAVTEDAGTFGEIRRKHLHKTVGETCFENGTRDGRECHLEAQVYATPCLFVLAVKRPQRFCILRVI